MQLKLTKYQVRVDIPELLDVKVLYVNALNIELAEKAVVAHVKCLLNETRRQNESR